MLSEHRCTNREHTLTVHTEQHTEYGQVALTVNTEYGQVHYTEYGRVH